VPVDSIDARRGTASGFRWVAHGYRWLWRE